MQPGLRMEDTDYKALLDQLIGIEGIKLARYRDAKGNLIVAGGQDAESAEPSARSVTLLEADVRRVASELDELWPRFEKLDPVRQRVMIHMAFTMRVSGLLAMMRFVSAMGFQFWETAAEEVMISQWAKGEKWRATVLAEMLRTGRDQLMSVAQPRNA
jgi:lysozyme